MGEADAGFRTHLCQFFGLSRSAQYKPRVQSAKDAELAWQIRAVLKEHRDYGHRRIADELGIGKNRIRRVMKAQSIPSPKRRKQYIKVSGGSKPAPANLLKEYGLVAARPHYIWAEDFTYLWFQGRFYYLATVIDLYSRQVVGWSLGTRHDTSLITAALMDAVSHYRPPQILHNDRGSEYLSKRYQTICGSLEIALSASKAGSPWENGFQESFYNHFKLELGDLKRFDSEGQLLEAVALQLHYYNTRRIHSSLHTNPAAYAARFEQTKQLAVRQNRQAPSKLTQQITTGVRDKVCTISGT